MKRTRSNKKRRSPITRRPPLIGQEQGLPRRRLIPGDWWGIVAITSSHLAAEFVLTTRLTFGLIIAGLGVWLRLIRLARLLPVVSGPLIVVVAHGFGLPLMWLPETGGLPALPEQIRHQVVGGGQLSSPGASPS